MAKLDLDHFSRIEKDAYDRGFQDGMRKAVKKFDGPYIKEGEKIEFIKMCWRCDQRTAFVKRKIYEDQDPWLVCGKCNEQ